jgi:CDP-diacylglycerol--glycerol-3-phosphate 3-phosphatidyltransferase
MALTQPTSRGAAFRAGFRARIERPVAAVFMRTGLTPNALTLIGFGISVVGAWLASSQLWFLAGLIAAFGAVFDLFDGALARATGKSSKLGAFLDSTFDRAGEAVVYIGIALGLTALDPDRAGQAVFASTAAMAAAFMVSYSRAKSESLGFSSGTGMANIGFAPREVRTVLLSLGLIVAGLIPSPDVSTRWLVIVGTLGLIAVLATLTTIQRILFVYNQSRSINQEVQK